MDDLILQSAAWQAEHFFDYRSLTPGADGTGPAQQPEMGASKVVVLSFGRNRMRRIIEEVALAREILIGDDGIGLDKVMAPYWIYRMVPLTSQHLGRGTMGFSNASLAVFKCTQTV